MKPWRRVIWCILILVFLAVAPGVMIKGISRNIFSLRRAQQQEDYRGTLEIWHVVSFKTAEGSGYRYLQERCTAFEKKTPYVFLRLRGLTAEAALELLAAGEQPDLISYPMGFLENEQELIPMDQPKNLAEPLSACARSGMPYMADTYVLLVNRDLFQSYGAERSYGDEFTRSMFLDAMEKVRGEEKGILPLCLTDADGRNPAATLRFPNFAAEDFSENAVGEFSTISAGAPEQFLSGKAGMLICPYSEYRNFAKNGMNFSYGVHEFTFYTDLVQKIGAFDSGDAKKNAMMLRFLDIFFTNSAQKKLEELGMLPACRVEGIYAADGERAAAYGLLQEKAAVFSEKQF